MAAKLLKVGDLKDKQLAEAKKAAEEKATLVESKEAEIKIAKDKLIWVCFGNDLGMH